MCARRPRQIPVFRAHNYLALGETESIGGSGFHGPGRFLPRQCGAVTTAVGADAILLGRMLQQNKAVDTILFKKTFFLSDDLATSCMFLPNFPAE
jgi:hypothetical protein